jgi:molecular chaperone DnaK
VTFDIDANGILNVSARDLKTNNEKKIRIESSSGLSQAEVERMRKDAESHAEDDKRWKELVDTRNMADQVVYQIEKLLRENADKISESDKAPILSAVERVKKAASGEDVGAIKQAIDELQQASQAMAQHIHRAGASAGAQPSGDGAQAGKGGGKDDDVIDAEFEVKK